MSDGQPEPRAPSPPLEEDQPPADTAASGPASPPERSGLEAEGALSASEGGEERGTHATQTAALVDAAVQCEPLPALAGEQLAAQLAAPELADFLAAATPRCEAALQQNELADPLADELAALAEEDADGQPGAGGGADADAGSAGGLQELHSFSDLVHSKGRVLTAVAWHPARRGVCAVAAYAPHPQQPPALEQHGGGAAAAAAPQPLASAAAAAHLRQPPHGCILVWSHADSIHPELVLQPPAEVHAFAFHPTAPHAWLAAGLVTGQVALFSLQAGQQGGDAPQQAHAQQQQPGGGKAPEEGGEEGGRAVMLLPACVSSPEACHQAPVSDLQWLPGALLTKDGRLEAAPPPACGAAIAGGSGTPAPAVAESSGAGAGAAGAPPAAAAPDCTLFASTAADGSLLLWDMRLSTRQRKAAKADEEAPEWRPVLALAAASAASQPLLATRFCRDARAGAGRFLLGSLEGEVALADAACFAQARKGAHEWSHNTVGLAAGHTGRVLALAFSPFFPDTLLVVGDSGFALWRVGAAGEGGGAVAEEGEAGSAAAPACLAVYESPFCADALYTCGCWSPTKPGGVLLGRADGRLEAWDLTDRSHQAAMVAPVAPCALTALAVSPASSGGRAARQLVAAGDAGGTLRLLELPRALRRRGHAEVKAMAALLAREQSRLAEVGRRAAKRAAEARAAAERARAEAAAAERSAARAKAAGAVGAAAGEADQGDGDAVAAAEARYLAFEAEWRERLASAGVACAPGAALPVPVPAS